MKRYCFVGASTTEGMGDCTGKGWVGNTAVVADQRVVSFNLGIRGQTIFQIAERAASECRVRVLDKDQGGIVLGCALNELARVVDGSSRCNYTEVKDCYSNLIADLAAIAPVIVIGAPPVLHSMMPFFSAASGLSLDFRNADIARHDEAMHRICSSLNVPYVSIYPTLTASELYQSGLSKIDGLHSDAEGYAAMASLIEATDQWKLFFSA